MARTVRTPVTPTARVATPSFTAVDNANGESFVHDGSSAYYLEVKNANASPCTVTVKRNVTIDGATLPDLTVSVPATTGDKLIGPIVNANPNNFTQPDGSVYVDFSIGASVTACLYKMPTN